MVKDKREGRRGAAGDELRDCHATLGFVLGAVTCELERDH